MVYVCQKCGNKQIRTEANTGEYSFSGGETELWMTCSGCHEMCLLEDFVAFETFVEAETHSMLQSEEFKQLLTIRF